MTFLNIFFPRMGICLGFRFPRMKEVLVLPPQVGAIAA